MPTPSKPCTKCGEIKPLDDFHRHHARPDGRVAQCKACKNAADRERRAASTPDLHADRECPKCGVTQPAQEFPAWIAHRWRSPLCLTCQRERRAERDRERYWANREKQIQRVRDYRRRNREYVNQEQNARRQARHDTARMFATRKGQPWEQWELDYIEAHPEKTAYQLGIDLGRTEKSADTARRKLKEKK